MKFLRLSNTIFTFIIFFHSIEILACDICGCGVGGGFLGVLPQFQKNLVGYRYTRNAFLHPPTELNRTDGTLLLRDEFHIHDLWMRYYLSDKTQLFTFVPYRHHTRIYEDGSKHYIAGIGDIQLNVLHQIVNQSHDPTRLFRHIWFAGGGLRLPTGQYMQRDEKRRMYPLPFQIGTGAWSFQMQNMYILRVRNIGVQTDLMFRHFLTNELEYQIGNNLVGGSNIFYWWQLSPTLTVMPIVGFQVEHYEKDREYSILRANTGGRFGIATIGLDMYYKGAIVQLFGQLPVSANITNSQPSLGSRLGVGLAYFW